MEYFFVILPKMFTFLLLIIIGIVTVKVRVIDENTLPVLSGLLIKIILPLLNVALLCERQITFADLWSYKDMVFWQVVLYLMLACAGILCVKLARIPYPQCNVHRGCMVGGNYAYMVIPLIYALFDGTYGVDYIPICSTVDTVVVWTLGLTLFTWVKGSGGSASLRKLWNPITGSILFALTLNTLGIRLPTPVMDVVSQVGNISGSLGLIYMGCNLALIKKVQWKTLKRISLLVAAKLIAVPLLIYYVAGFFLPRTEQIILMLIAGAPSMTTSVIIAKQYDLDTEYAAEAVSITTMSCLVTVPLLFLLISFI